MLDKIATSESLSTLAIREDELQVGLDFIAQSKTHKKFLSPKSELRVDYFLLRTIARDVSARRRTDSNLPLLVGTVVREHVPDTDKRRRALGNAYKSAIMAIYRKRKEWQKFQRQGKRRKAEEALEPVNPRTGQIRLI